MGTLGSAGTWCGTGACFGTLGSHVEEQSDRLARGGTLGSFATFSGAIDGPSRSSTCWGTMFGN